MARAVRAAARSAPAARLTAVRAARAAHSARVREARAFAKADADTLSAGSASGSEGGSGGGGGDGGGGDGGGGGGGGEGRGGEGGGGGGGGGCGGAEHDSRRPEPSREAVRPAAPPRGVEPRALPARAPAGWPSGPAGSFERGEVVGGWQGRARGSMPARRGAPASQCEMKPLEPPPSRRLDSRDALDTPPPFSSATASRQWPALAVELGFRVSIERVAAARVLMCY